MSAATDPCGRSAVPGAIPAATGSGDLGAPLYIAWQVTNECNLACLHCIEESGPGKAFRDELNEAQVFDSSSRWWTARFPTCHFRAASRRCIRCSSRWWSTSAPGTPSSRSKPTGTA